MNEWLGVNQPASPCVRAENAKGSVLKHLHSYGYMTPNPAFLAKDKFYCRNEFNQLYGGCGWGRIHSALKAWGVTMFFSPKHWLTLDVTFKCRRNKLLSDRPPRN